MDVNNSKLPQTTDSGVQEQSRSWTAPLFMLIGLLAGTAFAIGHHFYYHSLNGQQVDTVSTSQTWILRIGTLFAFVTKLACFLTVSTAYVQLQWYNSRRRPMSVQNLDAMSSVLHNILSFFDGMIFLRLPVLGLMALICWTLPIVPVITPGTINVIESTYNNVTLMEVPQAGFYNPSFKWVRNSRAILVDTPIPPITPLMQAAFATAVTDQVLACNPTFLNSSYTLSFLAPVFKCQDAPTNIISQISEEYGQVFGERYISYISWTPGDPWITPVSNVSHFPNRNLYPLNVDISSSNATLLYIMTNDGTVNGQANGTGKARVNITECSLYNATYIAAFDFVNGKQSVTVENIEIGNSVSVSKGFDGDTTLGLEAYTALAASLGTLLVGVKDFSGLQEAEIDYTSIDLLHVEMSKMGSGVERLFQNIVLSTFCNSELATSSAMVNVAISRSVQQYSYQPSSLVLTYALALSFSLVCSVIGLYAFKINKSSYQNSFSSFMRATSGSKVHYLVRIDDAGADPRPEDLAGAMVEMNGRRAFHRVPPVPVSSYAQRTQMIPRKPLPGLK